MFNGNNLPHELLLTKRQTTKLRNTIENNMPADIKLSKTQISKIIQSGGFLGFLLSGIAGPLMKVVVSLAKHLLAPLGITAATSVIGGAIQKKKYMVLELRTLIISNEEMNDIMNSNILLKRVTKTIKNETKVYKKEDFLVCY